MKVIGAKNLCWKKKGLIYKPSGEGFFKTHATRPIPVIIDKDVLRVYFCSRNDKDVMYPTYIDVQISNPVKIIKVNRTPLIELGEDGTFDDSGFVPNSIAKIGDNLTCFYTGWKKRRGVKYEFSMGIANINEKKDKTYFQRQFKGPFLAQDINHPFFAACPYVINEGELYKMWYCSGTGWVSSETGMEPLYRIYYAESNDGIHWNCFTEKPCIEYDYDGEVLSAPWVIKISDEYHMWYSKRGSATKEAKNYTIGYAVSSDGLQWERHDDHVNIFLSSNGWDSEMMCYPAFVSYQDKTYMFYSGNNVGKGGIGYAVTERFF